ncbi:MAG: hypothetical protein JWP81_5208 [Ferruginibacter sp.]|nr:hypothetical protein [Ferruginibacter sp.]
MTEINDGVIIEEYKSFLKDKNFPCIAAKAALAKKQVQCRVAHNMACPMDDGAILQWLYDFVDLYRSSRQSFHSLAIIFKGPLTRNEADFDGLMWRRLQALRDLDNKLYPYDERVDADPKSARFSFSLKEEGFFIIALHPGSNRAARQFKYPALVFNPHAEFEKLREANRYENMKTVVRKRDLLFSGSTNPMLKNFGEESEVYQYSGRIYDSRWKCPLKNNDATDEHHPTA